jgi:hypothetical protein
VPDQYEGCTRRRGRVAVPVELRAGHGKHYRGVDPAALARQADLAATSEAIRTARTARSEVTRAYRDLHVDVPHEFDTDPDR